jgi:CspA family cold shock protein
MIGVVKAWVGPRGFGFIAVPDHADVFLHRSALPRRLSELPEPGDTVEFTLVEEARGLRAANARIVKRAEPARR